MKHKGRPSLDVEVDEEADKAGDVAVDGTGVGSLEVDATGSADTLLDDDFSLLSFCSLSGFEGVSNSTGFFLGVACTLVISLAREQ